VWTDTRARLLRRPRPLAKSRGHIVRVAGEDNDCRTLGDDYSWTRVNVYLKDGVVEIAEAF